jgi:hypothetical protein
MTIVIILVFASIPNSNEVNWEASELGVALVCFGVTAISCLRITSHRNARSLIA